MAVPRSAVEHVLTVVEGRKVLVGNRKLMVRAGAAMAASSVTVVTNANRLRFFEARSFSGAPSAPPKEVAA